MKRLIPATIIFVLVIIVCFWAHIYVENACNKTLNDIEQFRNKKITGTQLENKWQEQKENMSIFVNHGFLDKISIYIGQLTIASSNDTSLELNAVYKNIESVLVLIKSEQKFGLHSFY